MPNNVAYGTPVRRLWRTVAPTGLPVTVDEARDACQSLYSGDDARLLQLVNAAVAHIDGADGILGRAIMPQTWRLRVDYIGREIDLPLPPLISVSSVAAISTDFVSTALLPAGYTVTGANPATVGFTDGMYFGADITFVCGYAVVPETLRLAILMLVRHWYDHPGVVETGRIAMHALPMAVDALLGPYKVQSV